MNREKFPEKVFVTFSLLYVVLISMISFFKFSSLKCMMKVPFRLTRMLVKAMEVSGIEGNFRSTCENVMQVLRSNKDSVMAMMEVSYENSVAIFALFS